MPSARKRKATAKAKQAPSIDPPPECVPTPPAPVPPPSPPPVVFEWKMEVLYNGKEVLNKRGTHTNFTFTTLQLDATLAASDEAMRQNKDFHSD